MLGQYSLSFKMILHGKAALYYMVGYRISTHTPNRAFLI